MKIAYADCFSGINGTMFLAALLDAGLPVDILQQGFECLKLQDNVEIRRIERQKGVLRALTLEIAVSDNAHFRRLTDILELFEKSALPAPVKRDCGKVYQLLAEAEARVHGETIEKVQFHEVGRLRAILLTVGSVWGLAMLEIDRLYSSPLPYGGGMIESEHGQLPLPAPATLEVLRIAKIPLVPSLASSELVTPSGAALLGALALFESPRILIESIGMGAGKEELPWPNILRVMIGAEHRVTSPEFF